MGNLSQPPAEGEIHVRASRAQLLTLERVQQVFGIDFEAATRLVWNDGCLRARRLLSRRERPNDSGVADLASARRAARDAYLDSVKAGAHARRGARQ